MARVTKTKNNRIKSEKKKKEEKLLPHVIDISVILPDQKQIILKGISTDRIIDVRKLLTVHVESCHFTNYSLSHETKGENLKESFEIVHLKPCVLSLVEEKFTEEKAIVNVRRLIDLFSCVNSFGISTKEREKTQGKHEEKIPKKKEKKERKELDLEISKENSSPQSESLIPSERDESNSKTQTQELKVDPLGIMNQRRTVTKSNKSPELKQTKSSQTGSFNPDTHENEVESGVSAGGRTKENETGSETQKGESKTVNKVVKFEEKEEAVEAMAKARAMAEKGDMTGMYPNQSKIGEFYDFFSLSHLHSPILQIEKSAVEISSERKQNGDFFEIEIYFTSGNPKSVLIVASVDGFYEKDKNILEKNIVSLLKRINKAFSQGYGELMAAFTDRNKFGNFPYGLRSNTFLIPPSAAKNVFSFSQLPLENENWNGNGGGVDLNNFKHFKAFSSSFRDETSKELNINWQKYFFLLSKMPCETPEERLIRDRKVFLFHNFFVEFAAKKTVTIIEKIDSERLSEVPIPDKALAPDIHGSKRVAKLEVENLQISIWRSATDASAVNCLKIEIDPDVFDLPSDNETVQAFENNLMEKNLLKGISADESATVHDLNSLGCLLVQHRGYLAYVKASNLENCEVKSDVVHGTELETQFETFNQEIKAFEKLFEADGGSNSLNPSSLRTLLHRKLNNPETSKKQSVKDSTDLENLNMAESLFRNILLKSIHNLQTQNPPSNSFIRWELGACWQQNLQNSNENNNAKEGNKKEGLSLEPVLEAKDKEGEDSENVELGVKDETETIENMSDPLKERLGLKKFQRLVESKTGLHSKTVGELIQGATDYYDNTALPKLVSDFASLELSPVDGKTLTDFMHTRGLRIRSLGKVVKQAENLPHIKSLCIHEMVSRAFKKIIMSSISFSPNHLFDASIIATCFNFILGKTSIPLFSKDKSNSNDLGQGEDMDTGLSINTSRSSIEDISDLIWKWVKLFIAKRYDYDISLENEVLRKLSILRSLCLKVGIEIAPKNYDFESFRPFNPNDIISMVPIFKHVSCSSADGRTLLEASKNFLDKGKLEDAVNYGTRALTKLISVCGPYNRMTAGAYSLLAVVLYHTGDFNQATIYQQKALDINERELGLDNPDTMKSYGDLAVFYYRLQHTELALKYVKRALYLLHLTCGTNHPNTAATYINIAMMEEGLGNVHLALRYLHEALKCNKRLLGPDHIQTAASYHAIAIALSLMEAYSLSVQHEKTTLQILQEKLGSDDLRTQDAAAWLDYFESKAIEQQECIKNGFPKIDSSIASKGHLSVSDLLEFINEEEMEGSASNKKSKKSKVKLPKLSSNLEPSKKKIQLTSTKNKNERSIKEVDSIHSSNVKLSDEIKNHDESIINQIEKKSISQNSTLGNKLGDIIINSDVTHGNVDLSLPTTESDTKLELKNLTNVLESAITHVDLKYVERENENELQQSMSGDHENVKNENLHSEVDSTKPGGECDIVREEDGWKEAVSKSKPFSITSHKKFSNSKSNSIKYYRHHNRAENGKGVGMKVYREKVDQKDIQRKSSTSNQHERKHFRKYHVSNAVNKDLGIQTNNDVTNLVDTSSTLTSSTSHIPPVPSTSPTSSASLSHSTLDSNAISTESKSTTAMAPTFSSSTSTAPPVVSKTQKFSSNLGFAEILGGTPLGNINNTSSNSPSTADQNIEAKNTSNILREDLKSEVEQKKPKDGVTSTTLARSRFQHHHHNNHRHHHHFPVRDAKAQPGQNKHVKFQLQQSNTQTEESSTKPSHFKGNNQNRKSHLHFMHRDNASWNDKKLNSPHDIKFRQKPNPNASSNPNSAHSLDQDGPKETPRLPPSSLAPERKKAQLDSEVLQSREKKVSSIQVGISYKDIAISKLAHDNIPTSINSSLPNDQETLSLKLKNLDQNELQTSVVSDEANAKEPKQSDTPSSDNPYGSTALGKGKSIQDEDSERSMEYIETVKETLSELKLFSTKKEIGSESTHDLERFAESDKIDIDPSENSSTEVTSPSFQDKSMDASSLPPHSLAVVSECMDSVSTVDLSMDEKSLLRAESSSPEVKNEIIDNVKADSDSISSLTKLSASAKPYVPARFGKSDDEKDVKQIKDETSVVSTKDDKQKNVEVEGKVREVEQVEEGENIAHFNDNPNHFPRNFQPSFFPPPFYQAPYPYPYPPIFRPHGIVHPSMIHPSFHPFHSLPHSHSFGQPNSDDDMGNKNVHESTDVIYCETEEKAVVNVGANENKNSDDGSGTRNPTETDTKNVNNVEISSNNFENGNESSVASVDISKDEKLIHTGDVMSPNIAPHPSFIMPQNPLIIPPYSSSPAHFPFPGTPQPLPYPHAFPPPMPHVLPLSPHSPTSPHIHAHPLYPSPHVIPFSIPPQPYPHNAYKPVRSPPYFLPYPQSEGLVLHPLGPNVNFETMNPEAAEFIPGKVWSGVPLQPTTEIQMTQFQNPNVQGGEMSTSGGNDEEGEAAVEEKFVSCEMEKRQVNGNEGLNSEINFSECDKGKNTDQVSVYEDLVKGAKVNDGLEKTEITVG